MSPSDRRLYDLIRAMGTPTGKQLHDRLGMQYDYLAMYAQLAALEDEGWIRSQREEVTDPERLAARGGRHERVFYVARVPEEEGDE